MDHVRERMDRGLTDIGILLEPVTVDKYDFVRLPVREEWVVAMHPDAPLAAKEAVTAEDLAGVPLILPHRMSVRSRLANWFGDDYGKLQVLFTSNLPSNSSYYFKKLTKLTLEISFAWNLLILILTPFFMRFYALEPETKRLVFCLVLIHNVFNAAAFPFSGALSSGLRAAGDVKFTMYVSVASTVAGRLALSYLLGIVFDLGVIGLALAMACDWSVRAVIFVWRQRSGIWKKYQVI